MEKVYFAYETKPEQHKVVFYNGEGVAVTQGHYDQRHYRDFCQTMAGKGTHVCDLPTKAPKQATKGLLEYMAWMVSDGQTKSHLERLAKSQ